MDLEHNFLLWLEANTDLSKSSIGKYVGAVRTISRYLTEEFGQKVNIFTVDNPDDFKKIMNLYESY